MCPLIALQVGAFTNAAFTAGRLSLSQIMEFQDTFIQRDLFPQLDFPDGFDGRYVSGFVISGMSYVRIGSPVLW